MGKLFITSDHCDDFVKVHPHATPPHIICQVYTRPKASAAK